MTRNERMKAMNDGRHTLAEIGREFGVSPQRVSEIVGPVKKRPKMVAIGLKAKAEQLYHGGMTQAEVAEELEVSRSFVARLMGPQGRRRAVPPKAPEPEPAQKQRQMVSLREAIAVQRNDYLERTKPDEDALNKERRDAISSRLRAIEQLTETSRWMYEHGSRVVFHEEDPWSIHVGAVESHSDLLAALDDVDIDCTDKRGQNDYTTLVVLLHLITNIHPLDEDEAIFAPVWDMPPEPVCDYVPPTEEEVAEATDEQIAKWAKDRPDCYMTRIDDLMMDRLLNLGYTRVRIADVFDIGDSTVSRRLLSLHGL